MRQKTTDRYINTMIKLLSFILRGQRKLLSGFSLILTPEISENANKLISVLSDGGDGPTAVHALVTAILSQVLGGVTSGHDAPGYQFIALTNVQHCGKIKDLDSIRATLSELRWTFRATTFFEITKRVGELPLDSDPNW